MSLLAILTQNLDNLSGYVLRRLALTFGCGIAALNKIHVASIPPPTAAAHHDEDLGAAAVEEAKEAVRFEAGRFKFSQTIKERVKHVER